MEEQDKTDSEQDESKSLLPQDDEDENQQAGNQSVNDISSVSGPRTPEKKSQTAPDSGKDIFEDILYSVKASKNNGRILILFSTKELYSTFIDSFQKGYQPQEPEDGVMTFKTHIQRRKCVIIAHDVENGPTLTGPGNKLWKETIFSKRNKAVLPV